MKYCIKCGQEYSDGDLFCSECNIELFEDVEANEVDTPNNQAEEIEDDTISKAKDKKFLSIIQIILCIAGIGWGIATIISGRSVFLHGGDRVAAAKFGADFYTEIYDATRTAANNIDELIEYFNEFTQTFFILLGVVIMFISFFKLCDVIKKMKG